MIYEKHKESTAVRIGIVIVNETEKNHNIKFLGYDNVKPPEGVLIYNSFGNTLYDDNRLGELRNWINSIGAIQISLLRLNSDNSGQLQNDLSISKTNMNGTMELRPLHIHNYRDPNSFNFSFLDLPINLLIDSFTSFEYIINKFSGIHITFFPSQNQVNNLRSGFNKLYDSITEEYKEYDSEKRKKLLFLS